METPTKRQALTQEGAGDQPATASCPTSPIRVASLPASLPRCLPRCLPPGGSRCLLSRATLIKEGAPTSRGWSGPHIVVTYPSHRPPPDDATAVSPPSFFCGGAIDTPACRCGSFVLPPSLPAAGQEELPSLRTRLSQNPSFDTDLTGTRMEAGMSGSHDAGRGQGEPPCPTPKDTPNKSPS